MGHKITPIIEENEEANQWDITPGNDLTPGLVTGGHSNDITPGVNDESDADAGSYKSEKASTLGGGDEFALPMKVATRGGSHAMNTPSGLTDNGQTDDGYKSNKKYMKLTQ